MRHYIVVNSFANEYETGTVILDVAHSLEEAKEIFNQSVANEKQYAHERGFTVFDDCETVFDAGEEGYYASNHTKLYIQMV